MLLRLCILPFLIYFFTIAAAPLPAEKQSVAKKPAEWSQAGPDRILSDSPWSLPVSAVMDDPADRSDPAPAPLPGAKEAGLPGTTGSQAGQQRWDGGVGKNRMGRLPTIPVVVRWESAATLQTALKQKLHPLTGSLAEAASKDFILEVTGLIPAHRYRTQTLMGSRKSSSTDDTSDPTDPEEVLESFMAHSLLILKGTGIQPENVRLDADTGAIHIFFPRRELPKKEKEILFSTSFGTMRVQARFRLKDMLLQGKPDL